MKIVVDSYAWMELFLGSEKGEKVKEILMKAETILTPDTVLAELARKYIREKMNEATTRKRLNTIVQLSEIVGISEEMALESARQFTYLSEKAKRERSSSPSLFDAMVLAVAKINKAKVLTGDQHFKGLPETIWLDG